MNINNCNAEKRKNATNKVKNGEKICENHNHDAFFKESDMSLTVWVKALLLSFGYIPNIIKLVDKAIASKAESPIQGSLIFGDYKHGTYNQVEELLDMQERKLSLINIYTFVKTMVSSLDKKYQEFIDLKFVKKRTVSYISQELDIDERTAFRWSNNVINKLVIYCKENNYTSYFIESQLTREGWIKEVYKKCYQKLINNYSKSSSSIKL